MKQPTIHYAVYRTNRQKVIALIGEGEHFKSYLWDRGHKNGPEVHEITTTGIIKIYNRNTEKLITKLIARPGQLMRYFKTIDSQEKQKILNLAIEHERLGYNEV